MGSGGCSGGARCGLCCCCRSQLGLLLPASLAAESCEAAGAGLSAQLAGLEELAALRAQVAQLLVRAELLVNGPSRPS